MKYLKTHPIHENDSNLSDMTVINKNAEKTVVPQERDENTDNFQHLSNGTKIKSNTDSTVDINGEGFQKLSNAADMEVNPSNSKPTTLLNFSLSLISDSLNPFKESIGCLSISGVNDCERTTKLSIITNAIDIFFIFYIYEDKKNIHSILVILSGSYVIFRE